WSIGISRQQHFGLDMDEQRSHVDEFGSDIYIQGMDPLDVSQVLGCDIGNRDVINVDFLLANDVQKQIQRPLVNITDGHSKGKVALFLFVLSIRGGWGRCYRGLRVSLRLDLSF